MPVRILHGDCDEDVPWQHGLRTYNALRGSDIQFTLVKGGDHRLSRDADILTIHHAAEGLAIHAESSAASPSR
jgi:dipeptidyl aminopeptidase/acylaminoacyl peptidase